MTHCFRSFFLLTVFFLLFSFAQITSASTLTVHPLSDAGDDSADWTNTVGDTCDSANCFSEVDETSGSECTTSDGDTSYIESSVAGATQTFNVDVSSIADESIIAQIDITVCHERVGTVPPNTFQTRYCLDGVCSNSEDGVGGENNYTEETQTFTGLNVAKSDSTDIDIGVALVGTRDKPVKISQVFAVITYDEPSPPQSGGTRPTRIRFSGQMYPMGTLEIIRKGSLDEVYRHVPKEESITNEDGTFSRTYTGLLSDKYICGLKAIDVDGRESGIRSFAADLLFRDFFEFSDIFFPPTVSFEPCIITKGKDVHIAGYAAPNNSVELEVGDIVVEKTQSNDLGYYEFILSTENLELGKYRIRVRQIAFINNSDGLDVSKISDFSTTKTLTVTLLGYPEFDFNGDGHLNTADWSIFLFRWDSNNTYLRTTIDVNNDGVTDVKDFSIFLKSITI